MAKSKQRWTRGVMMLLVVGVSFAWFAYMMVTTEGIITNQKSEYNKTMADKKQEEIKSLTNQEKQKMMQEDAYKEKIAREKLGLVKPGERIFMDTLK